MKKIIKERRNDFLKDKSDSVIKGYSVIFKKADKYEEENGKIFEEFNKEDFIAFIKKELIGKSSNSMAVKISLCKQYLNSINNDCADNITKVQIKDMVDEYLNKKNTTEQDLKYISWNELKKGLVKITNEIDMAIVCLIRMNVVGEKLEELIDLKTKDIDLANRKIYLKNRVVDIKDEFVYQVLKDAIEQKTYVVLVHSEGSNPKSTEYDFNMLCPYFLKQRPIKNNNNGMDKYKFSGCNGRVFRIFQELNMDISAINLIQSYIAEEAIEYQQKRGRKLSIREVKEFLKSKGYNCQPSDIATIIKSIK